MKAAYPVILSKGQKFIVASIPDFDIGTQGESYAEAIEMARDAIGLVGIDLEDDKEPIPQPSDVSSVKKTSPKDIITLVDVDFAAYRRKHDLKIVRRNVSIPSWLDAAAKEAKINVSAVLTKALQQELQAV